MNMRLVKIDGVRGFMPVTYAVFYGNKLLNIFLDKKSAKVFIEQRKEVSA